jgi:hypothetical protein
MRRNLVLTATLMLMALGFTLGRAQDNGVPDTLYVEVYPGDDMIYAFPADVRFNLRVTNDIPDPNIDSIAGMVIPLCFTSSNAGANVTIPASKNNADVYPWPDLENSIFRHMPSMADPQEHNWMMDLSELWWIGPEWDTRILDIGAGDHFWLSIVPTGTPDQRFPGGSRLLTATMTFTVEDSVTICIDTCFWPPTQRLAFSRSDAVTYFPQHFMPVCQEMGWPGCPPIVDCPPTQEHHVNGTFVASYFYADEHDGGVIVGANCNFAGQGVENVHVWAFGFGTPHVSGWVEYDVTDHCQSGGVITITCIDDKGLRGDCGFSVVLSSASPEFNLLDAWRALAGYTMGLPVSATDPDGNPVSGIDLDGFWYEPDSLQPPVNPPSFDGGNPGFFSWAPEETEIGTWIASFSAADSCGSAGTHRLTIEVGPLYCGDCNADGEINLADVVYLIADLFKGGPPPDPVCKADANCSGYRDVGDVVVLINYLFKLGQAPCFECCP